MMATRPLFQRGLSVFLSLTLFSSIIPVYAQDTPAASAPAAVTPVNARVWSTTNQQMGAIAVSDTAFPGMLDATSLDLGGDGIDEVVVAYGFQSKPELVIYRLDGSIVNRWFPYEGVGYDGKIVVAAGDLNGDGRDEIITSTGEGGGPFVRIFDGFGKLLYGSGFFAYDKEYRRGTNIAAGDINGDGRDEIVVSVVADNTMVLRAFNGYGEQQMTPIERVVSALAEPAPIAVADITGDTKAEIIAGASFNQKPLVTALQSDGTALFSVNAFEDAMRDGVSVAVVVREGKSLIATAPRAGSRPEVRFYSNEGKLIPESTFRAFEETFLGGLVLAAGKFGVGQDLLTVPQVTSSSKELTAYSKLIMVDLSEQRLYAYNRGKLDKTFLISSGLRRFPTPVGTFAVYRKRAVTRMTGFYGAGSPYNYDLPNVKWAMSFYGAYNLHGTYWHSNLGHVVSHGCVNISNKNAEWLYRWSPMGTVVKVQQ
jgi:lipoprotein-anchoring transpeptidase ErfK/SrfK